LAFSQGGIPVYGKIGSTTSVGNGKGGFVASIAKGSHQLSVALRAFSSKVKRFYGGGGGSMVP